MAANSPLSTRPVFQWEIDSTSSPPPDPGNAPFNCGPCSVTKILEFYHDRDYNVNHIRRTVADDLIPTNVSEQAMMMKKQGLDADIAVLSITRLTEILASGRRPVLIGLDMSQVPPDIAGHPFRGAHAVVALTNVIKNGVYGKYIMDPNFSPRTGRTDPTGGKRFYPNYIVNRAMDSAATMRWGVVPKAAKIIQAPAPLPDITEEQEMAIAEDIRSATGRWFSCKRGVTLRKGPGTKYPVHHVTEIAETFWLHGFGGEGDDWVYASRRPDSTGFFWVPPAH